MGKQLAISTYWPWHFSPHSDVNDELNRACQQYQQTFGQLPHLVVLASEVKPSPVAGLQIQGNFFLPTTVFYFAKPNEIEA